MCVKGFDDLHIAWPFSVYLSGIRKNEEGVPEDEENFDEAIKSVNMGLVPTRVGNIFYS